MTDSFDSDPPFDNTESETTEEEEEEEYKREAERKVEDDEEVRRFDRAVTTDMLNESGA